MRLLTLQSVVLLAITGAAAGIYAGNSAVDSINPFFYSPLPNQSFASLTPYRATIVNARPAALSDAESRYAIGRGCVGCRTYPEEYVPDSSFEEQAGEDYHPASLGYQAVGRDEAEPQPVDPARQAVARYATYPVSEAGSDRREIEQRAAEQSEQAIVRSENAEALRAAEDKAVQLGPEQLIY